MPRTRGGAADTYHHGNLRQVLLTHAVELASAGGPDAVVLRDVQRMAGVSNSAAYRHYSDRDALLAAVREYAESQLSEAMALRLNAIPRQGPKGERALARLRATGQGYIDFALAEPGLFRTVFALQQATKAGVSDEMAAPVNERHPFQILVGCIDDLVATGVLPTERRDGLDEAAWGAVHGLSTLFIDGPLREADAARKQAIAARLLDVITAGLR